MMELYPAAGPVPAIEQQLKGDFVPAPLDYNGVRQQLPMEDLDQRPSLKQLAALAAPAAEAADVSAPASAGGRVPAEEAAVAKNAAGSADKQPSKGQEAATPSRLGYAEVRRELELETTRLRASAEKLVVLEDQLASAKIQSDVKEAAALTESFRGSDASRSIHDALLVAFGALMGAAGLCIQRSVSQEEVPEAPRLAAGAVGLAFSAAVWSSSSPALSSGPINPPTVSSTMPVTLHAEPEPSERPLRAAAPRPPPTSFATRVPAISAKPLTTFTRLETEPSVPPWVTKAVRASPPITAMAVRPEQPVAAPRSAQQAAARSVLQRLAQPRATPFAASRVDGVVQWPHSQRRPSSPELGEY